MRQFDIFLSYKSDDSEWVERLKGDLQKRGVHVWLDRDQIRPGDLFAEALENGLETCRAVGLVVTPKSVSSGWVKEEYYRALSLTKKSGLRLIPIWLRNAELPAFLESRQHIDFRNEADYERMIEALIWPGLTGKKIAFSAIHGVGSFDWPVLAGLISDAGFRVHASDYVETATHEIPELLKRGYRVIAVVDLFEDWLPSSEDEFRFRRPEVYAATILEVRKATKGTPDEIVFVLYQHPDAFTCVPHLLPDDLVQRFRRYFQIPKTFHDRSHGSTVTPQDKDALNRNFKDTLYRVEKLLLRTERQSQDS
jgi:hypothetical protein